jgi:predicted HAD superfamily Cof-like phosphohydrolase
MGLEQPGETVADALARVTCERDGLRVRVQELLEANGRLVNERRASLQAQVRSFFAAVGQEQPPTPCVPSEQNVRLRMRLFDEVLEFFASCADIDDPVTAQKLHRLTEAFYAFAATAPLKVDLVDYCDACIDVLYIAAGALIGAGVDLEPLLAEVTRSNLSKQGGGKDEHGKARKGENYSPPDIDRCLRVQGWMGEGQ